MDCCCCGGRLRTSPPPRVKMALESWVLFVWEEDGSGRPMATTPPLLLREES